jgi:hypothetical protein
MKEEILKINVEHRNYYFNINCHVCGRLMETGGIEYFITYGDNDETRHRVVCKECVESEAVLRERLLETSKRLKRLSKYYKYDSKHKIAWFTEDELKKAKKEFDELEEYYRLQSLKEDKIKPGEPGSFENPIVDERGPLSNPA